MARFRIGFAGTLLVLAMPVAVCAAEDELDPPATVDFAIELEQSDLEAITMAVLQRNPVLAASAGIKFAQGYRGYPSGVEADVVFFPHAESRGEKQAFQVHCSRIAIDSAWICPSVDIRRYVKLDSQDFEVRVKGDIDTAGVLAVAEATRPIAATAVADKSAVDTIQIIFPSNHGYIVSWGSADGNGSVTLWAYLRNGGNPSNADDWDAEVIPEETE